MIIECPLADAVALALGNGFKPLPGRADAEVVGLVVAVGFALVVGTTRAVDVVAVGEVFVIVGMVVLVGAVSVGFTVAVGTTLVPVGTTGTSGVFMKCRASPSAMSSVARSATTITTRRIVFLRATPGIGAVLTSRFPSRFPEPTMTEGFKLGVCIGAWSDPGSAW